MSDRHQPDRGEASALKSYSAQTDKPELSFSFTTTARLPRHLRYGYTSSPVKQCHVPSCLVEIVECVSNRAPTKRLRPHPMAAFSVNSPFNTLLTTITTAPPRISAAARLRTLLITLYTMAQAWPSIAAHNWLR